MAWREVTVMDQRVRFISEYLEGYFKIAETCRQFDISRKTGHKWIGRYEEHGLPDRIRTDNGIPFASGVGLSLVNFLLVSIPTRLIRFFSCCFWCQSHRQNFCKTT